MYELRVHAPYGLEYEAQASLWANTATCLVSGAAVMAPRRGYDAVSAGTYAQPTLRQLPAGSALRADVGVQAVVFSSKDGSQVLVHSGNASAPTFGSIRLEPAVMKRLASLVREGGPGVASMLVLRVSVERKPSALKFWARPKTKKVRFEEDYDLVELMAAHLENFFRPNGTINWGSCLPSETPATFRSGQGGDFAGAGASGSWSDAEDKPARRTEPLLDGIAPGANLVVHEAELPAQGPQAAKKVEPLFQVSAGLGVDGQGRVTSSSVEPIEGDDASRRFQAAAMMASAAATEGSSQGNEGLAPSEGFVLEASHSAVSENLVTGEAEQSADGTELSTDY